MSKSIAEELLAIEAVFLSPSKPFIWSSGIKSPIYCDNRLILSYPKSRSKVEQALAEQIKKHYPDVEVLMGTSTAGIAHAAIVGDYLGLPMGYVRGSEKRHGRKNVIEGKLLPDQKVVVIEDLISTAGSVINVVEAIRQQGGHVLGIASLFTYELTQGLERLKAHHVRNVSLATFSELIEVAVDNNYITNQEAKRCVMFQQNPTSSEWFEE